MRAAVPLVASLALLSTGCSVFSVRGHRGPPTDHFDGERFHNQVPAEDHGPLALLKWMFTREAGPWREYTDASPGPPPPARVGPGELRVTFVNHSTVLLQLDGVNVLTDPVWSDRVGPVSWAGAKRHRPPGIRFEDLPPIDVVLVSHNHYDHFDLPTLARLVARDRPRILVGLGNRDLLVEHGIGAAAVELDWWDSREVRGLTFTAVPASHWSNRGLADRRKTLWCGYAIEGAAGRVVFAGDTGYGPHFAEIRERLGPPRLALLPIGAYRPRWFMERYHMNPADALLAHRDLAAGTSVGIHFGTFSLADDGEDEPAAELRRLLDEAGADAPRFWALENGEGRDVPPPRPAGSAPAAGG
jgi:L-ascorbate metabolism protein UlaG (beta-lactamase superfamily)